MINETEIYEMYLRKIRTYVTTQIDAVYFQIDVLEQILGIDSEYTKELIINEKMYINGERKYKEDTLTYQYSSKKERDNIIKLFGKYKNGGYKQITTDYIESEKLNKGIILQYKEHKSESFVLAHCILP